MSTPARREVPCPGCGTLRHLPPSWEKRGTRYCSKACRMQTTRQQGACAQCGVPMVFPSSEDRRYCSAACQHLGRRKRTWEPCAVCGTPDGPHYGTHKTPGRNDARKYGIDGKVCYTCHSRLFQAAQRRAAGKPTRRRRAGPR